MSQRALIPLSLVVLLAGLGPRASAPSSQTTAWLAQYIAIDTSNPPGNEAEAVAFLRKLLHQGGITTRVLVSPEGRSSLYARLDADPASEDGALLLLHHMDIVPPGPGWTRDPFSGLIDEGRIWGRGAVDDKSLGIAHLAAFLDLARSEHRLQRSVVFLAVADEESGGAQGTGWLLERHPELFRDVEAVLGEGGLNRAHADRLLWWGVEVAQKRPLWIKATAHGRGGHGSMLNLGSAPHQLTTALARLLDRPLAYRVSPPVREYLEAVAPYQSDYFSQMVDSLDDIVAGPEPHRKLFPGIPNYLLDTVQVNVLNAGERINVVPASASALIDVRLLPDTDQDQLLEEIQAALGPEITTEVLLHSAPAASSSTENPIYSCLARFLSADAPVVPSFIPGITDSRYFRQRGIDAYGFSPFVIDQGQPAGIHGKDENISVAVFEQGVAVMRGVLEACVVF